MSRGAIKIDWPIQSDEKTWGQEKGHVEADPCKFYFLEEKGIQHLGSEGGFQG